MLKLCHNILYTYTESTKKSAKKKNTSYAIGVSSSCEIESREYNNVFKTKTILYLKRSYIRTYKRT